MDSDYYRFGQTIGGMLLFIPGIVLVMWGFQQRQVYEKRQDGRLKIKIGAWLLVATCFTVAVPAIFGPDESTDDPPAAAAASSEADIALEGANRYLRGIDQVRVTGEDGGERFDITFIDDEDATGTLTSGAVKIRMILVGGDTYINPSDEFWAENPEAAAIIDFVDGRWIRVDPDDSRFTELTGIADRDLLTTPLREVRDYKTGAPRTIHGVECISVRPSLGGVLYLAQAPARLMRVEDGSGFAADFDYDAPEVTPKAPAEVVEGRDVFDPDPKA